MPGRTPRGAADDFFKALSVALRCITPARLAFIDNPLPVGEPTRLVLNRGQPVQLRTSEPLYLFAAHTFVARHAVSPTRGRYTVTTHSYAYSFLTGVSEENPTGEELLSFHWTPFTEDPRQRTFAHCHVGAALLTRPTPVAEGRFHKVHIPTERLCVERIVRLAIEEFGAEPLREDWWPVLQRGIAGFERLRTDRR